jgi:hypothetical protein
MAISVGTADVGESPGERRAEELHRVSELIRERTRTRLMEREARALALHRLAELHPAETSVLLEAARKELGLTT